MFDGQSLNIRIEGWPTGRTYPFQTFHEKIAAIADRTRYAFHLPAISGTTFADRSTGINWRMFNPFGRFRDRIVICVAGTSDLLASQGNLTATQTLTTMETYADLCRANGASQVVMATVTPSVLSTVQGDPDFEVQRTALNTLIRANANGKFDAVMDIAAIAGADDVYNAAVYYDGTHPTEAMAGAMGDLAIAALQQLGVL